MFLFGIISIFILAIILSWAEYFCDVKKRYIYVSIILFIATLTIIVGNRGMGIDSDYLAYSNIFEESPSLMQLLNDNYYKNNDIEIGYIFINSLISSLGGTVDVLFIMFALIHLSLYYKVITLDFNWERKTIFLSFLSLLSFQYIMEMAQLRQGIVCSLTLLGAVYLSKGRYANYLLTIAIGCLFHYTALLGLLIYPFSKVSWNYKKAMIVVLLLVAVLQYNWIDGALNCFFQNTDDDINVRLVKYAASSYEGIERPHLLGDIKLIFLVLIISLCQLYVPVKLKKIYNVMFSMLIIGCLVRFSFHEFTVFSSRLAEIFFPSLIVLIPFTTYLPVKKGLKYLALIAFFILSFYQQMNGDALLITK